MTMNAIFPTVQRLDAVYFLAKQVDSNARLPVPPLGIKEPALIEEVTKDPAKIVVEGDIGNIIDIQA